jgi:hypothetical protein
MAISRFNYTGLRKIDRKHVRISLEKTADGGVQFRADLTLTEYKFPENSLVFVEAYRQTTWMRFAFGAIESITRPVDTSLANFDSPDDIQFRVRVTATGEHQGMMLGEADRIRPVGELDDDDERAPLLRVRASDHLGDEVYKVEMQPAPTLLINRKTGDWRAVAASTAFQSLTAPAILRSILIQILVVEKALDPDDTESPHARWLRFARNLPGVPEVPEDDIDPIPWIEDVVRSFAKQKAVLASFMGQWQKGGTT